MTLSITSWSAKRKLLQNAFISVIQPMSKAQLSWVTSEEHFEVEKSEFLLTTIVHISLQRMDSPSLRDLRPMPYNVVQNLTDLIYQLARNCSKVSWIHITFLCTALEVLNSSRFCRLWEKLQRNSCQKRYCLLLGHTRTWIHTIKWLL